MNLRPILIAYGLANAILYSALLPLWEGFDEPFHFGYVQRLANGQGPPDPRTATLSREVANSILLAPAAPPVKHNLPEVTTYSEYFALPQSKRAEIEAQLREIPPDLRWQSSDLLNYEGQHPPLAYLALAAPERLLAHVPLPVRVLILRVIASVVATLLLYAGASKLCSELGLAESYRAATIFCIFSLQMTWATVAHVANDWLAVPLAIWTLTAAIGYWKAPRTWATAWLAGLTAAGLLTKAYFLALVPLVVVVCLARKSLARKKWMDLALAAGIILAVAAPWYIRNAVKYGALSGMQEARAGFGPAAAIQSTVTLDWTATAVASLRSWLWTGNNSFTSFSLVTEAAIIAIWLVALVLWAAGRHQESERVAALYVLLFAAALLYATLVSYASSGGIAKAAAPWYSQVLATPLLALAYLGCARRRRLGGIAAAILVALFAYVLAATYVAKLIPLYGGYQERASLALLWKLYSERLGDLARNLDLLSLAPARVIFALTALVVALAIALAVQLTRTLIAPAQPGPTDRP